MKSARFLQRKTLIFAKPFPAEIIVILTIKHDTHALLIVADKFVTPAKKFLFAYRLKRCHYIINHNSKVLMIFVLCARINPHKISHLQ